MITSRKRLGDITKNVSEKKGGKDIRNKLTRSVLLLPVTKVCYIHTFKVNFIILLLDKV